MMSAQLVISFLILSLFTSAQQPDTVLVRFNALERTKLIQGFEAVDSAEVLITNSIGDTMFNKNILFEKDLKLPMGIYTVRAEIKDYPAIYEEVAIFDDRRTLFFMSFIFEKKARIRKKTLNRHAIKKEKVKHL